MAEPFGLHGKITATEGNGDARAPLGAVREQIARAMPTIARPPEGTEFRSVGSKGVDLPA